MGEWVESTRLPDRKQFCRKEREELKVKLFYLCVLCTAINQNPRAQRRFAGARPGQEEPLRQCKSDGNGQRNERQGNGTRFCNLHSSAVHSSAFAAGSVGLRLCRL